MKVNVTIKDKVVRVQLKGGARDPLLKPSAAIDWDFTFVIDFSGTVSTYTFKGKHDGFPAYDVYINDDAVWTYDPGGQDCVSRVVATVDGQQVDLIRPVADYCSHQVFKLFPFDGLDVIANPRGGIVP
jgi:hypothetical protein